MNSEQGTRGKRRRTVVLVIIAVVIVGAGAALLAMRGTLFGAARETQDAGVEYTEVTVTRGDILITVPGSGSLEPVEMVTVRPDPNMPTRRITKILVREGERVTVGQPLVQVDGSGLDLELAGARASYESARLKLEKLRQSPTEEELTRARSSLLQAESGYEQAQQSYESTKRLVSKGLAAKDQLADAERQLAIAKAKYEAEKMAYDDVADGVSEETLHSQEAAVAQAENNLRKAQLVANSVIVRSPAAGMVAEIKVMVGDLAGSNTALMIVADTDPMILEASVDETDIEQVTVGQRALLTLESDPERELIGRVKEIAPRAQTQNNITVFIVSIEVPNPDGSLLWGMNADAEIVVTEARDVLLVPSAAVKTSGGKSIVNILDEGKVIPWEIRIGAGDGSNVEVLRGLDEGDTVVIVRKRPSSSTSSSKSRSVQGAMFRAFR